MPQWRRTGATLLGALAAAMVITLPGAARPLVAHVSTARLFAAPHAALPAIYGCTRPSTPGTRCLDLVADGGFDPNGLPLNPRWGYQTAPFQPADVREVCTPAFSFPATVNASCTRQSPSYDGPSGLQSRAICALAGGYDSGHSNWFTATYKGRLYWGDHSSAWGGDDDYSMDLQPPGGRGVFHNNPGLLHLEFDSDETIDHFRSAWWSDFHRAVDNSDASAAGRLYGQTAIATGLLGIDWVHTPGLESHPVYALAIHTTDEGNYVPPVDKWAFFVRNSGNEGYCSSDRHGIAFYRDTYWFKLDWQPGAADVRILQPEIHSGLARFPFSIPLPGARVFIFPVPRQGIFVTFYLPPSLYALAPFYDGEIRLHWIYAAGHPGSPRRPPPSRCSIRPGACSEADAPEKMMETLFGPMLSASQKATIGAEITQPDTPDVTLGRHRIHIRRLHRAPSMRARRPKNRRSHDPQHARRDKLQQALLCGALGGVIPGFPTLCPAFTTVLSFDDQPLNTEISNQYVSRGVTFGPATGADTRAPRIASVGAQAHSGSNVLRFGQCFSPSCEFGMQYLLTCSFTTRGEHLGMFLGEFAPGTPTSVTLKAYDANNGLIGQTQAALTAGNGFQTPITFESTSANIARVVVSAPEQVGVDDFAFS
jgi:hypothetical protein